MNEVAKHFSNGQFQLEVTPHPVDGFRVQAPGLARALGFREAFDLVRNVPEDEKGSELVRTPGGDQNITYVTEAGFYRVLGQRQPSRIQDEMLRARVEAFQNWVYREVLPSIRATGGYEAPAPIDINAIDPRTLALAILEESDRANAAEKRAEELAPKATAYDKFLDADGYLDMGTVANIYKVGRQTLFDWLKLAKVLQADRRPYQEFAHWFEVKATSFERSSGMTGVSYSSKLRPAGLDPLFKLLVRRGYIAPGSEVAS